jgi:glutamate N-acetyltransferase/amino-acid N-acetyltransferase
MLKEIKGGVTAPKGYKAAGVKAGIKKSGKEDLAIVYSTQPASGAAVFTTNKMAAAPVIVSKRAIAKGKVSAVVVNAGCANACTGSQGILDAQAMAHMTGRLLNVPEEEVLVASTGVIGVNMPMGKVAEGIKAAVAVLHESGAAAAEAAIMTTDTFSKSCAYEFQIGNVPVRIAGMAKGSGMIHPNMATMLAFITTDAAVSPAVLQMALKKAVDISFNMISVDGDTSTNDMVSMMANGLAGNKILDCCDDDDADYGEFTAALTQVCVSLAKQIARDGEGATKFLEINVTGAANNEDAKKVAMSVAKSPLVKTAFFGEDPNWGRIVCAAGYAGAEVDPEKISLVIGDVCIVKAGEGVASDEADLRKLMSAHDIAIMLDLNLGKGQATVWSCDLSYEYVKINGEYHT